MRACPRKAFLPNSYLREAYVDAPVRLEELDFNVSAPHMHATCLEALDLKPGLRYGHNQVDPDEIKSGMHVSALRSLVVCALFSDLTFDLTYSLALHTVPIK